MSLCALLATQLMAGYTTCLMVWSYHFHAVFDSLGYGMFCSCFTKPFATITPSAHLLQLFWFRCWPCFGLSLDTSLNVPFLSFLGPCSRGGVLLAWALGWTCFLLLLGCVGWRGLTRVIIKLFHYWGRSIFFELAIAHGFLCRVTFACLLYTSPSPRD